MGSGSVGAHPAANRLSIARAHEYVCYVTERGNRNPWPSVLSRRRVTRHGPQTQQAQANRSLAPGRGFRGGRLLVFVIPACASHVRTAWHLIWRARPTGQTINAIVSDAPATARSNTNHSAARSQLGIRVAATLQILCSSSCMWCRSRARQRVRNANSWGDRQRAVRTGCAARYERQELGPSLLSFHNMQQQCEPFPRPVVVRARRFAVGGLRRNARPRTLVRRIRAGRQTAWERALALPVPRSTIL
ncbi:hypothetical protein B0T16DRAFT_148159 [Cercophora newfieldiana]|uniref:Uncharacterized protein n=1 Tax=Cercophora newfieldiana TaxID=92897 RepID=A0AA40CNW6_9PEZI|nr:hypothetical protein B0T16DRAFT_148159 [Cercophora newfieldiana]